MKYTSAEGVKNQPYDFGSVMHFGKFEFSRFPQAMTIHPKYPYGDKNIGQRESLSEIDIKKVNAMYNCPSTDFPSTPTTTAPSATKNSGTAGYCCIPTVYCPKNV